MESSSSPTTATPQPKIAPNGFTLLDCPTNIVNKRLPAITTAKSNINDNSYFCYSVIDTKIPVSPGRLRFLFRNPLIPWTRGERGLHMETPEGKIWPTHVPSIMDVERLPDVAKIVLNYILQKMEDDEEDESILPTEWAELLDPEPTMRNYGRIFLLKDRKTMIETAKNTDQYDVFWVSVEMTHLKFVIWEEWQTEIGGGRRLMNMCQVGGGVADDCEQFPHESAVVVWNVRGANRLEFKDRFNQMIETHKLVVVILMETRSSESQFDTVRRSLMGNYHCAGNNLGGLKGGLAVLWDRKFNQDEPPT